MNTKQILEINPTNPPNLLYTPKINKNLPVPFSSEYAMHENYNRIQLKFIALDERKRFIARINNGDRYYSKQLLICRDPKSRNMI